MIHLRHLVVMASLGILAHPREACGADLPPVKTHEPIYQAPFDLAAGGASLTRATQEGAQFANPSLTALGAGVLRSLFLRSTVHVGADAVDLAAQAAKSILAGEGARSTSRDLMGRALKTPVHVGADMAMGALFAPGGFSLVATTRADLETREFGDVGLPQLHLRALAFSGAAAHFAQSFRDKIAIGVGAKALYGGEARERIGLNEIVAGGGSDAATLVRNKLKRGYGLSVDLGTTIQRRSRYLDSRLAVVVNDVGTTTFTGSLSPWKQTVNVGFGVTPHTRSNALHCAVDLRDIGRVYGEHWTRRTYAGCRLIFARLIGFGIGMSQGWPSFGTVVNLFFLRLEAGTYSREWGSQAGVGGRRVYFFAVGGELP